MPAGFGGGLVSGSFLDGDLPSALAGALGEATRRAGLRRLAAVRGRILRGLGPASGPRAVLDIGVVPLLEALGFDVVAVEPRPPGFVGLAGPADAPLAVIAAIPWGMPAERAWRDLVRAGRVAGARWGLVGNGASVSLVDASRPWTRGMLTCDLDTALADERAARLVWGLLRREALEPRHDGPPILERAIGLSERSTSRLCDALGDGVLDALGAVIAALGPGRGRAPAGVFDESLTLVYRVLFLLFAEARGLVPAWHPVYRDGYTVAAMRRRLEAGRDATGFGEAFGAMSRLAHAGCRAGDLTVTAFNGRLFSPRRAPAADRRPLPDEAVRDVVRALATAPAPAGARRRAVAYADLGVEQLGAVYERVLEYEPGAAGLARTSTARKTSGSFYTPRAITRFLVRRTLAPLVAGLGAEGILALRVVDPAMGSGAFLVAACDFLARACEDARLASGEWAAGKVTDADRAALRREVASRCLYGVDCNPMAVQLARLSIWLTTLAADRPLTFLDHHLSAGDSLVGAGLADLARLPGTVRRRRGGDGPLPLFDAGDAGATFAALLPDRVRLAVAAETADGARDQERRHERMHAPGSPLALWKRAADIWVAAWAEPAWQRGLAGELIAHALGRPATLGPRAAAPLLARAEATAGRLHPLHWELEFPEVFFDADGRRRPDGGFDAVLGN
ncbi:MAG: N-6 DNA methylase, partial [Vicinamibacterales bacterium]